MTYKTASIYSEDTIHTPNNYYVSCLLPRGKYFLGPKRPAPRWQCRYLLVGEVDALLDVALELVDALLNALLLVLADLANGQDLLNAVLAELDLRGEVLHARAGVRVHEGALGHSLAAQCANERVGKASASLWKKICRYRQ